MAGFKIIRAYSGGCETRVGKIFGDYKGGKNLFRTLDDDGNVAYHALCDNDDMAEWFNDWSARDVGSCSSDYKAEDGAWKGFIG